MKTLLVVGKGVKDADVICGVIDKIHGVSMVRGIGYGISIARHEDSCVEYAMVYGLSSSERDEAGLIDGCNVSDGNTYMGTDDKRRKAVMYYHDKHDVFDILDHFFDVMKLDTEVKAKLRSHASAMLMGKKMAVSKVKKDILFVVNSQVVGYFTLIGVLKSHGYDTAISSTIDYACAIVKTSGDADTSIIRGTDAREILKATESLGSIDTHRLLSDYDLKSKDHRDDDVWLEYGGYSDYDLKSKDHRDDDDKWLDYGDYMTEEDL